MVKIRLSKTILPLLFLIFLFLSFTFFRTYIYREQNDSSSKISDRERITSDLRLNPDQEYVVLRQNPIFDNQLFAVYEALLELNMSVEWAHDFDVNDTKKIYITTMVPFMSKTPIKYISYNWEQLGTDKVWENDVYDRFRNALEVWDYSTINVKVLKEHGIDAKIILPGSAILEGTVFPMDKNGPQIERDLDLVFIGDMNDRRKGFWKSVKDRSK
jgi:hypothetical protein